jgi:hypothetical protein
MTYQKDPLPLFSQKEGVVPDLASAVLDKDWAKVAFLTAGDSLEELDAKNKSWSSADLKFTDTRLGGNIGINARPSFTRYADIRCKGRITTRSDVSVRSVGGEYGMGRYYSEAIDDNAQIIYLRFGNPMFNSLTGFFTSAHDPDAAVLARSGRAPSVWYKAAKAVTTAARWYMFPAISVFFFVGAATKGLLGGPVGKFYSLKPAMHAYWSAVHELVNSIAINSGVFPKVLADAETQRLGKPFVIDESYRDVFTKLFPDVFNGHGFYDVWAIANRAQRQAVNVFMADYEALNKGTATDFTGYLKKEYIDPVYTHGTLISGGKIASFRAWLAHAVTLGEYIKSDNPGDDKGTETSLLFKPDGTRKDTEQIMDLDNFFDAEFRSGSQFAIFRVDPTGASDSSFSNATTESDLSQKINQVSSQARELRFTFAEGNLSDDFITNAAEAVVGAGKDILQGTADGFLAGLPSLMVGLAGASYIDIPKHWQSSTAALPRSTYTMDLVTPYGNPLSRMQNLIIPMCMVLAGALPLSTGKATYTSPFICQLFDRGRNQIKLGIIETVSISRGTTDLEFTNKGQANGIKVTFTVADLTSIMHIPISSSISANMLVDEDNLLMDYIAVLSGQDLYSQIFALPKAQLKLTNELMKLKKYTSPAYWASSIHDEIMSTSILNIGGSLLEMSTRDSFIKQGDI